jgi:integrase
MWEPGVASGAGYPSTGHSPSHPEGLRARRPSDCTEPKTRIFTIRDAVQSWLDDQAEHNHHGLLWSRDARTLREDAASFHGQPQNRAGHGRYAVQLQGSCFQLEGAPRTFVQPRVGRLCPYQDVVSFNRRVRELSGVERFRSYLCRHTFATEWRNAGGSLAALQAVLGDSRVKMTEI